MYPKIPLVTTLLLIPIILAACSTTAEESRIAVDSPPSGGRVGNNDVEITISPSAQFGAVPTQTTAPGTTVTPTAETETEGGETTASEGYFADFASGLFGLRLTYPDSWLITEHEDLGLFVESEEGFLEAMPDVEGAALIILPRDELAGEDITEALRLSVFEFGPPPDIFIEYPSVSTLGDQEIARAAYNERDTGVQGHYAFVQRNDRGVFIFAATAGLAKPHFLGLLETVIDSIELEEGTSAG